MPTAAQRQRAAALAQLNNQHKGQLPHRSQAGQPPSILSKNPSQLGSNPPASASKKKIDVEWDDGAFSDEDSEDEEAAAFEMDGHDVWTQNYCSICDTLIEPGQGLNARRDEHVQQTIQNPSQQALHSPTSSIGRNSSNGLKSKSGTIKARPPSSDGTSSNVKRTHSAGRIHAVGGSTGFGASKRTGSAGSRLNALSELKPTTKLNPDNSKNTRPTDSNTNGNKSPAMSRRDSSVSVRSGNSGGAGANSSGPSSPLSPTSNLPRTKKGGIMGTLTPAALKQQEDLEIAKSKAPPALYCSERCRLIDEQRGSGMGELVYYLHQPTSPTAPWQTSWSSRTSNPNVSALALNSTEYRITTPESECNCPECMEKNSASGTVPSGASDTTESSNSYQYGPRGYKQRTTSGRIVTPQNLYPPGGHRNDYFGNVQTAQYAKRGSQSNAPRDDRTHSHTHRDSISQTGTESSARSSDSGSDLWEPRVRGGKMPSKSEARARSDSTSASVITSDAGRGSTTTGTVTPDGILNRSMDQFNLTSGPSIGTTSARHYGLSDSLSTSQASTASPLRLLRNGDHRGMASVDVTADIATSPQPYANTVLSRSIASERTEDGASSGFTVAAPSANSMQNPSILDRRQSSGTSMVDATISGEPSPAAELSKAHLQRYTDSPAPLDSSNPSSRAVGTLKSAQARAAAQRRFSVQSRDVDSQRRFSTNGDSGQGDSGSSGSSWLKSSISAAWNTLRGAPSGESNERRESIYESNSYKSEERGMITPSAETSDGVRTEEPTPTQSLIKRPTIKRGDVPAFANEIGRGGIPGERSVMEKNNTDGSELIDESESTASLSKSVASAHGSIDSERLRKKAERERAHRHQRSRDVAVLPPLLGIARPSSNANLQANMRTSRTYSSTSIRSDAAPDSPSFAPTRSNTPGLRRGSSHSASLVGLQEYGTSPGRMAAASFGTSPRRAGLGWGALTPLGPHTANTMTDRSMGNQASNVNRPPHNHPTYHHHHHNHHHGHQQHHHHHHTGHHGGRQSLQPPHHRSQGAIPLGTIGMLGMHPHGNSQIKGRHSTTPVRMSTPRVPEHGGEMSGAQLKGEEVTDDDLSGRDFMQSRSLNRRSYLVAPPTRPQSGMSMRGQGSMVIVDQNGFPLIAPLRPPSRTQTPASGVEDGQSGTPMKLYPVLDVPNRQPIHDRYDTDWALGDQGLIPVIHGNENEQKQIQQNNATFSQRGTSKQVEENPTASTMENPNDPSRKKLFYFDAS